MTLIENEKRVIEVGFSKDSVDGNWGAFQSKEYRFWNFYFRIIKPTMSYIKHSRNYKNENN
jgi:hypothetical protein